VVALLIGAGASVDQPGQHGTTPLMAAAANGRRGVVEQLLEAGANPLQRDEASQRAHDLARAGGHAELAELLERRRGGWRRLIGLRPDS
jgi:ankyrin repeat protein